jgi:hypothetical protein
MCHDFINHMKKDIEKKLGVSIDSAKNGWTGVHISFVKTICGDVIDRAGGGNHYLNFP